MRKRRGGKLFIVLIITGVMLIFGFPFTYCTRKGSYEESQYTAFRKTVSEHTITSFEFEGVKVTVTDITFWMIDPIGPFVYPTMPDLGIFIDELMYELYLTGDVKALFVLNHELGHIMLHHDVGRDVLKKGDPILTAQYNKNEIAADVWAVRRLGLSLAEYESARKWLQHIHNRDLNTRVSIATYEKLMAKDPKGPLNTYGTLEKYLDDCYIKWKKHEDEISGIEAEQIAEVAKQIR
jgi:hypothetical protein